MQILKALVIVEIEDHTVRQVVIDKKVMMQFLSSLALKEGALTLIDPPLEGITLEYVNKKE